MANIVNLISIKDGKILVIKRRKEPYKGMYGLPGGHVEAGETNIEALEREILEETKQILSNISYITSIFDNTNDVHLYKADVDSDSLYDVDDEGVEEVKRLSIPDFIENLKTFKPNGWEKLLSFLK